MGIERAGRYQGGRRVAPYCRCPHPLDLSHGAARQARVWHRNRCWLDHGPVGGSSSFSHRLSCWFSSQQFGGQLELVRRLDRLDRPRSASQAQRSSDGSLTLTTLTRLKQPPFTNLGWL